MLSVRRQLSWCLPCIAARERRSSSTEVSSTRGRTCGCCSCLSLCEQHCMLCWLAFKEQTAGTCAGIVAGAQGPTRRAAHLSEIPLPCGLLRSQVLDLVSRDLTPNDYELLLQLDEANFRQTASRAAVASLPAACTKDFCGEHCVVCLLVFNQQDSVTALRCNHLFHQQCISKWLLERCPRCPICGGEV